MQPLPLFLFAAAAIAAPALRAAAAPPPNILVILTDDQGWADIGYNNPSRVYTPNLDRLATEGAVFANHYVMPQCTPTRVAALTGRYPGRFGADALEASNGPPIPHGTATLASALRSAGYATALSGKWHLGSTAEHGPNRFGFDHAYGSFAGAVGMYDHRYRPGPFEATWHRDGALIAGHENGRHATDLVADDAVRHIRERRDRPFFLYLAFHAPHTPLDERGRFADQPTALDPDRPGRWRNEEAIEWFNDPRGIIQRETDPAKRLFLAAVHHMDHAVGRVVQALDETGQRERTLILFSSDNGPQRRWVGKAYPDDLRLEGFNQPLPMRGAKCDVWEGGIKVPGFAHWPGRIAPRRIAESVHIVDWFPTLARLAGAPLPPGLDGRDLTPALLEGKPLPPRPLAWAWGKQPNRWALREGDWKIVRHRPPLPESADAWQLFNLAEDPRESRDVAADHPEIVRRLHRLHVDGRATDAR